MESRSSNPDAHRRSGDGSNVGEHPARGPSKLGPYACIATVIVALVSSLSLLAQPPDRAQTEAMARRAAERLRALHQEAEHLSAAERTLLGDLRKMEVQRQIKTEEARQIAAQAAQIGSDLAAASVRVADLEQKEFSARPELRSRLVELYKLGQGRYLRLLLSTSDLHQVGEAARMVATLAQLDRTRIASDLLILEDLKKTRSTLQERSRRLETLKADAERARTELDRAVQAQNSLVRDIDRRRDLNAQLAGELQTAQQKLQSALRDVQEAAGSGGLTTLPFRLLRGDLDWPVAGIVRRRFGQTAASGSSSSNGIDIAAAEGTPAVAVHDGTVAFADTFSGFGNLVIVDHGSATFSLYGNLLDVAVKKGARVEHGQPIGSVGSPPAGTPQLYFELRVDGQPVDPLQWLKKR